MSAAPAGNDRRATPAAGVAAGSASAAIAPRISACRSSGDPLGTELGPAAPVDAAGTFRAPQGRRRGAAPFSTRGSRSSAAGKRAARPISIGAQQQGGQDDAVIGQPAAGARGL